MPTDASTDSRAVEPGAGLNLAELIPEIFERYFAFFRPGHLAGAVPCRIKELARLKIAALNECDT